MPPSDTTHTQGGIWERAVFTVPTDISHERVMLVAHKYMVRAGTHYESQGYTVLRCTQPAVDPRTYLIPPDRRGYYMWFFLRRRPTEFHLDVRDDMVEEMEKLGLRLTE